jgi:hypothetical protein
MLVREYVFNVKSKEGKGVLMYLAILAVIAHARNHSFA